MHSIAAAVSIVAMWCFQLIFTLITGYLYLWKLRKFKFLPLLILYISMVVTSVTVITYYTQCIIPSSVVNTDRASWLFYMIIIKLGCLIGVVGYNGLIIDLLLMLNVLTKSS